jgi:predicted small lipoprotein YifL
MCLNWLHRFFQPGLVSLCAFGLAISLSGCGKKAPLSLPDAQLTQPAANASASYH